MLLQEALELLEAGEAVCREAWSLEDGYLMLLQGMKHVWKIICHPQTNAGNYIYSHEDLRASDWRKFELPKPVIESVPEQDAA